MCKELTYRTLNDGLEAFNLTKKFTIFLGAGVSKSAGIPLASEIVESLSTKLYAKLYGNNKSSTDNKNTQRIDTWLKKQPFYDPENPYASVLDASFPNRIERAAYFNRLIMGKSPSKTHLAIATLMKHNIVSAVLTTNFDRLMEYAAVRVCRQMPVISLFDKLPNYIDMESKRPKIFKLHGDYLYGNIRNLGYEMYLVKQSMSKKIETTAKEGPLIVAGYSGGDDSVMDLFEKLATDPSTFPGGIYWLNLRGHSLRKRVLRLLEATRNKGSGVIEIDDSDTFFVQLVEAIAFSSESDAPCLKPDAHVTPLHEKDREVFVRERLNEVASHEFLNLLKKIPYINDFAHTPAALDYLVARYEEDGEIPRNLGEMVDRYVDLLVNGGLKGTCTNVLKTDSKSNANQRIRDLVNIGLLNNQEENIKIRNPILRNYVGALRLKETGVDMEQIGKMLLSDETYGALCFYVGLIEDATHVIESAIHQGVDVPVLYGRIRPWPDTIYKGAALIGYAEKVDRAYVERIADMLLLEFDVERWYPQGAISALASMGNRVIEQLIQYMIDPLQDTFSSEDVALALGRIGNRRVVDQIDESAQGLSPRDTKMVVYALGLTGNPRAIPILRKLASNVAKISDRVLQGALKGVGYDNEDISASAIEESTSPRPELDAQVTLKKYLPNLEDRRNANVLQEQFRKNPRSFLEVMSSLGWPPEAKDLSEMGTNLLAQNKPWEAEIIFAECLERYPMFHWNYNNLALAYSREVRPLAARRYYALGLSLNPDYADYYNDFAITMMKLNNMKAARHLLIKALSIDPDNYRPWLNLANVNMYESGCFENAELKPSINLSPGFYISNYRMVPEAIVDTGKLIDAQICLQKVLSLNPSHPTARLSIASLSRLTGKAYNQKIDLNEIYQMLHLGEIIIPEAVHIEDLPKIARDAWKRSGDLKARGDLKGSLLAMKEVRRHYPNSPHTEHNISLLLMSMGHLDDAIQNFEEALEKWPWDFHLLLNYSSCLRQAKRFRDAIKAAEKAVKVAPNDGASWFILGKTLYADGKIDEAADVLREAIRFSTPWSTLEAHARDLFQEAKERTDIIGKSIVTTKEK